MISVIGVLLMSQRGNGIYSRIAYSPRFLPRATPSVGTRRPSNQGNLNLAGPEVQKRPETYIFPRVALTHAIQLARVYHSDQVCDSGAFYGTSASYRLETCYQ
jgi:hypothetical protein